MQTISRPRKIVYGVLLLIAVLIAYTYFFTGTAASTQTLVTETPVLSQDTVKGKELLRVLLSLNGIKLDDSIFSDPLFTSLQDFSIALPDIGTPGRQNP